MIAITETERELIESARLALSSCNWTVGECAAKWCERYSRGRNDADFGAMVGLSGDQIYQRRRVWEQFADVVDDHSQLKWSHFYVALTWEDRDEVLAWADENQATVAEMKAWRRMQNGEDLTLDGSAAETVAVETFASSEAHLTSDDDSTDGAVTGIQQPDHDPAEDRPQHADKAPAGSWGVSDPNADNTRLAPDPGSTEERNDRRKHARAIIKAAAGLQSLGVSIEAIIQLAREGWANGRELGEVDMPDNETLDALCGMTSDREAA